MNCDMLDGPNTSCYGRVTHTVPGTPLGAIAMCDEHFIEWLTDNDGDARGVVYLTDEAFLASLDRAVAVTQKGKTQ